MLGYTNHYRLYREDDPIDYLRRVPVDLPGRLPDPGSIWTTPSCTGGQYPTVSVALPIDVYPGTTNEGRYNLDDQIALRNASTCT